MVVVEMIGYVSLIWVLINFINIVIKFIKMDHLEKYLCLRCFSFWLVLLYTLDPLMAATCSLMAYLLDKFLLKKDIEL